MREKEISVFEVLGPVMVGPSSSHTAGACRLGLWASQLADGDVVKCTFTLYGSFAHTYRGHGTDRALVGGMLGMSEDDPQLRTSFERAQEVGLSYEFKIDTVTEKPHPNMVRFAMENSEGFITEVEGKSIGGAAAVITEIDGIEVEFTGVYNTLIVNQIDKPGVLAWITRCLTEANVNIAFLKLFREDRGQRAFTIVETDEDIAADVVRRVTENSHVESARLLETLQSAARRKERKEDAEGGTLNA